MFDSLTMRMLVPGLILVGLAISIPVTALLVRLGHRANMLDTQGAKGHVKPELRRVPNIGGVAIFISIALPMAIALGVVWFMPEWMWGGKLGLQALADHLPRIRESTPTAIAMLGCMSILHVVGLIDDRKSLGPIPKFAVQFMTAGIMAIWFDVRLLTLIGEIPSIVVTILWIVAITNAINFLDNMDGLAGGVSAIAAALFMVATILNEQWFIGGTLALLVGGLAGFLIFNFPPAKIFMGDGGSLVVGFVLALLTARTTFYDPSQPEFALGGGWYGVFMPVIVLAIPLYDFLSVSLIRLKQGKSPFVGDQQHFSHRLVQRGLSKRAAVMTIWSLTAVTGIVGISLGSLQGWQAILVGVQTILVLVIIGMLEHVARRVTV
jgi:UDP-GlcNAc:undecaprenyl-phosphate GlcNAc-1-phosphate transferase